MKKARAFTVVEVLLVVVVIAILAAVVIPRMTGTGLYSKYLVYTTVHRIAADMRLARRLAVTTGDRHRLRCFQTGGSSDYNEYRIQRRIGGSWVLVGEVKYIPDEIIVSGTQTVIFNADGSANSNCTFRYRIGSVRYRVTVRQTTGRVKLEAY
jgi:prepilin-type N-terminal cleavage/methylation domain-containing protein